MERQLNQPTMTMKNPKYAFKNIRSAWRIWKKDVRTGSELAKEAIQNLERFVNEEFGPVACPFQDPSDQLEDIIHCQPIHYGPMRKLYVRTPANSQLNRVLGKWNRQDQTDLQNMKAKRMRFLRASQILNSIHR